MTLTKLLRTSAAALGALAVASVTQANAADIYSGGGYKDLPVSLPAWAGFYFGGHMGLEWSQIDLNRRAAFEITSPFVAAPVFVDGISKNTLFSNGGFGGGQVGYNWQSAGCCWVYGIELDLGGVVTRFNRSFLLTPTGGSLPAALGTIKADGGFYGDIAGRVGYTWGSSLIYAKGGFAWLNNDASITATIITPAGAAATFRGNDNNETLTGWTAGAGWEYLLNPNWSMKVEYLHFDFGDINDRCCRDGVNNFRVFNNDLTEDTVKLGFNYFFHPSVAPLK